MLTAIPGHTRPRPRRAAWPLALAVAMLWCQAACPPRAAPVTGASASGAAPPRRADRRQPKAGERLVVITQGGRIHHRWATPGDLLQLPLPLPVPGGSRPTGSVSSPLATFPLFYQGEPALRLSVQGRLIRVNDSARALRLTELPAEEAVALITRHRQTLDTLLWSARQTGAPSASVPAQLAPDVLEALRNLRSRSLAFQLSNLKGQARILTQLRSLRDRLVGLVLRSCTFDDDHLARLRPFTRLRALHVMATAVRDPGVRHLAGLRRLHQLTLGWARLTDRGVRTLARLKRLRTLRLEASSAVTPEGLRALQRLPRLAVLGLQRSAITDDGLREITKLSRLRALDLRRTRVTNAGLSQLASLSQLRRLSLEWTVITDDGLRHVGRLRALRALNLSTTHITNAGLAHLIHLNPTTLHLGGTRITGHGLKYLSDMTRLRILSLGPTNVDDAGLAQLARLRRLVALDLRGTLLTGRGLTHLVALRSLGWINLQETGVTGAAVERFRTAHPQCRVTR